jgi:cyclic-di-AMP phosphodiesterase PgpH
MSQVATSTIVKQPLLKRMRASGAIGAMGVAALFCVAVTGILMLRQDVVPYRPGEYVPHNITARVDFDFLDTDQLTWMRQRSRDDEPRVYRGVAGDYWGDLQAELTALPDQTYRLQPDELPADLRSIVDPGDLSALERVHDDREREKYNQAVVRYVDKLKRQLSPSENPLVILPADQRTEELQRGGGIPQSLEHQITLWPANFDPTAPAGATGEAERKVDVASQTYGSDLPPEFLTQFQNAADVFPLSLKPLMGRVTLAFLQQHPTYQLDSEATTAAQDRAAESVPRAFAREHFLHDTVIVTKGPITDRDWQLLRAENEAFLKTLDAGWAQQISGTALTVVILTLLLSAYVARFQPRIVRNHLRGLALAGLMVSMLLLSALAGIGSSSLHVFGVAPTLLVGIILTIAYDQRFALGVGSIQAVLVSLALNHSVSYFLILLVGLVVACFLLDDIRTRSKLIEVGGAAALALMAATAAAGMAALEPGRFILHDCLYAGAAGLGAGFVTLGILPFIERTFRITTSMTLLELADASQPLLRRLQLEAPGTYNHSLQVATLAESAAEAIGANSLACRVGAYYHDIGKVNKPDYFAENQSEGSPNLHLNVSPSVSLLIITNHVKQGMELGRQFNLPTTLLQFIQQHHGTTLVEYFYNEACKQVGCEWGQVPQTQYRYPGPKPKSKETAIMMLADCAESACRAMREPNASRIEPLVHELAMRRLHDGQFDECDLTLRDLARIEHSLVKTLLSIYHGRMAYPQIPASQTPAAAKTASAESQAGESSRKLA